MPIVTVWTMVHRPFVMGGNVYQPLGTSLNVDRGHIIIRCGRNLAFIKNPRKLIWHVADVECGAFVQSGKTKIAALKAVEKDLLEGDQELMKRQIAAALETKRSVTIVSNDAFWKEFK